jgi:hypothetical protein
MRVKSRSFSRSSATEMVASVSTTERIQTLGPGVLLECDKDRRLCLGESQVALEVACMSTYFY